MTHKVSKNPIKAKDNELCFKIEKIDENGTMISFEKDNKSFCNLFHIIS